MQMLISLTCIQALIILGATVDANIFILSTAFWHLFMQMWFTKQVLEADCNLSTIYLHCVYDVLLFCMCSCFFVKIEILYTILQYYNITEYNITVKLQNL